MEKSEREALAVDIARRVRLIACQAVPKSFLDELAEGMQQSVQLFTKRSNSYAIMRTRVYQGALHVEFEINNNPVARLRFDEGIG